MIKHHGMDWYAGAIVGYAVTTVTLRVFHKRIIAWCRRRGWGV